VNRIIIGILLLFPLFAFSQEFDLSDCCDRSSESQVLDLEFKTIYQEEFAGGANGKLGSNIWTRNSTVVQTAEGQFTVTFDTPHPDGVFYHISYEGIEDNLRDNPKVTTIEGTKSANGFQVMITVDDNGAGADIYEDNGWSFSVAAPCEVLSNASLSQGGDAGSDNEGSPSLPAANGKVVSDNFQDQQFVPFNLQVRNTTNAPVQWEAYLQSVPYCTIPNITYPQGFTAVLVTTNNIDGTCNHLFSGSLPAFENIEIKADVVLPFGNQSGLTLYCQ